jgi:hypothetical protein
MRIPDYLLTFDTAGVTLTRYFEYRLSPVDITRLWATYGYAMDVRLSAYIAEIAGYRCFHHRFTEPSEVWNFDVRHTLLITGSWLGRRDGVSDLIEAVAGEPGIAVGGIDNDNALIVLSTRYRYYMMWERNVWYCGDGIEAFVSSMLGHAPIQQLS